MKPMLKISVSLMFFCGAILGYASEEKLEVYYDFETDEAKDMSGNNRDGVVDGSPKLVDGVIGQAWEFDGATALNMDFAIMKEPDPELSVRCYILPEETTGQRVIFDEGGAWNGFTIWLNEDQIHFCTVGGGENHPPAVMISADIPDPSNWTEIAAIFGHGKMQLYVNGEQVGEETTDWQEIGSHGQDGAIGYMSPGDTAFGPAGAYYIGAIDEFRLYSRMLEPAEVMSAVSMEDKLPIRWGDLKTNL